MNQGQLISSHYRWEVRLDLRTLCRQPDRVLNRSRTEVQNVESHERKSEPTRGDSCASGKATVCSLRRNYTPLAAVSTLLFVQAALAYTPRKDSSGFTADPIWDTYELSSRDPIIFSKYFLVEGEELHQLYYFCLKCGYKIPDGRRVRLLENGTAPLVQYLCKTCSLRGLPVKRWLGQKQYVD